MAFYLENKILFVSISSAIRANFLKLLTSHFPRMSYKYCKVGSDRSVVKGSLIFEDSIFSSVSGLLMEEFF
jgi:hypothetical protein